MKRTIFLGVICIVFMLLFVNISGYITNEKVSNYMMESAILRGKIIVLDELRSSIVEASQLQELYILTQKQIYKDSFDKKMKNIYTQIDDLYSKDYIDMYEKEKLTYTLSEYEQLTMNLVLHPPNYEVYSEFERQLIEFNASQLKVLHDVTLDLTSESEAFKSSNRNVATFSSVQNKLIQGVSSVIAVLVSSFAYYFKSKFKIDDKEIEKVIDFLTERDNEDMSSKDLSSATNSTSQSLELNSISSMKDRIHKNEILLTNAKLLYKQSVKFQHQCDKSELILKDIDIYISKLRTKLQDLEDYPTSVQKVILDDIERQLYEFKISFKSLPSYNDFILDISKSMIDKE